MCGDGGDGGGGGGDDTGVDATGGQGTGAVGGSTGDTGAVGGSLAESESEAAISAAVSTGPSLGAAMAAIDPTVSVTPANQAMSVVSQTETAEAAAAAAAASAAVSYGGTMSADLDDRSGTTDTASLTGQQSKDTLTVTSWEDLPLATTQTTQNTLDSLAGQVSLTETTAEQQSQIDQSVGGRTAVLGRHFARASKGKTLGVALGPIQEENTQSLTNMVNFGLITNQEAMDIAKGDISEGGLGSMSPAVGWGVNSETGLATMEDLAALNVTTTDPTRGYEVTEPQPTEAGVAASYTLGQLNPTAAAGLMAIGSMMPGPVGFVGTVASAMNPNPGLLSALADEIGFETPSFLDPVTGLLDDITDTVTDVAGQALTGVFGFANEALDATLGELATAATEGLDSIGFGSTEEAGTGFDADAFGGVDGGGPDPDAQPATPPPPPPAPEPRSTAPAVGAVDTFLDTSATTSLVSIPDIATPTLGTDEDLGVAPMMTTLPRRSSFRRSRVTSARDRAFGAANLFRPTLSAGISL